MKTIPLSRLEMDPRGTLIECANSGQAFVVELPDHRLISIQTLEATDDDSLVDELIQNNPGFQSLLAKSKASPRKPFAPGAES